jgi:hypothetical protein
MLSLLLLNYLAGASFERNIPAAERKENNVVAVTERKLGCNHALTFHETFVKSGKENENLSEG